MGGKIFILAVSLFCGCDGYIAYYSEKVIDKCGDETYTSAEQICENNIIKIPCGNIYYNPKMQFCFEQDAEIYNKCGGSTYDPSNRKCQGNILLEKCGDAYYYHSYSDPASTQFCVNNVLYDKCGGKEYSVNASTYCSDGNIMFDYGTLSDSRDNKTYKTIKIDTQIWMAENLQHEIPNAICYDNNPDNCKKIGILYYWNSARTICPYGWHLPNNAEWDALINFIGGYGGRRLKAKSDLWETDDGSDEFGFAALPAGYIDNIASNRIQAAFFLSATEATDGFVNYYYILNNNQYGAARNYVDDTWAYVRCVED
jgi:uncharacterized protein (TIGR02145 family)